MQILFELGSHFAAPARRILALPPSLKIMRLFDVRPLWAVMRGVDCSGHMKALQSIWTVSGHYGRGTEKPGRSADFKGEGGGFNDRGNSQNCHPFNISRKEVGKCFRGVKHRETRDIWGHGEWAIRTETRSHSPKKDWVQPSYCRRSQMKRMCNINESPWLCRLCDCLSDCSTSITLLDSLTMIISLRVILSLFFSFWKPVF